jgi:hypothetical protein
MKCRYFVVCLFYLLTALFAMAETGSLTSSANPSTYGQPVSIQVKVPPQFASFAKRVTFYDGAVPLQTVALTKGTAIFVTSLLAPGTHMIRAIFDGATDVLFTFEQTVVSSGLKTAEHSSASFHANTAKSNQPQFDHSCRTSTQEIVYGSYNVTQPVTIYAVMNMQEDCDGQNFNSDFCTGNVDFYDYSGGQKTLLGTGSPVSGNNPCSRMFTTSSLTAGNHVIVADFEGNPDYSPSSGHITVPISTWSTTTSVASTPNPSTSGEAVTFAVTVVSSLGNTPTGKVKLINGTATFGTATLDSNGMATFSTRHLPVGTDAITVEYPGDGLSAKSASVVLSQVVNPAPK